MNLFIFYISTAQGSLALEASHQINRELEPVSFMPSLWTNLINYYCNVIFKSAASITYFMIYFLVSSAIIKILSSSFESCFVK